MRTKRTMLMRRAAGPIMASALLVATANRATAAPCEPDGTLRITVAYAPPVGKTIAGVKIDLDYPQAAVKIPGFGDAPEVKLRVGATPAGFLSAPNDLDDDLVVAMVGTTALPGGPLFTVDFDRCKGAPAPSVKDFTCKVEQASTDDGVLVEGASCVAAVTAGHGQAQRVKEER